MKTFNEFLNEGLRDMMVGKSNKEMIENLNKLNPIDKVLMIRRYNLSDEYTPSNKELSEYLKTETLEQQFKLINEYDFLSINLLPDIIDEVIIYIEKLDKFDTSKLLSLYQNVKNLYNEGLLHFLYDHGVFTVKWWTIENLLDDELGEDGYDEIYDMSLDDQIEFIEDNTFLDTYSLIDVSCDIIDKSEKFQYIKTEILKDIKK